MSTADVSTGRVSERAETVTYWHAAVEWYVPTGDPERGSYTGWIHCPHRHDTPEQMRECRNRLRRRIERRPREWPEIARALDALDATRTLDLAD